MEFPIVEEFLADLKQKFGNRNNKFIKVVELKKVKQESKTIKEFVQKFRKVVRENKFEKKLLIEKFKRSINKVIQKNIRVINIRLFYFHFSYFY